MTDWNETNLARLADAMESAAASLALIAQHLAPVVTMRLAPTTPEQRAMVEGIDRLFTETARPIPDEPFHIDDLVVDKPSGERGRVAAVRPKEIKVRWSGSMEQADTDNLTWWPAADFTLATEKTNV